MGSSLRSYRGKAAGARPRLRGAGCDCYPLKGLFAVVGDPVGGVDGTNHFPVLLIGNGHELGLTGVGEFRFQGAAFPLKAEEGVLDLLSELGVQVVNVTVAGSGEGL